MMRTLKVTLPKIKDDLDNYLINAFIMNNYHGEYIHMSRVMYEEMEDFIYPAKYHDVILEDDDIYVYLTEPVPSGDSNTIVFGCFTMSKQSINELMELVKGVIMEHDPAEEN